jgi:itaconate CoA-transferase
MSVFTFAGGSAAWNAFIHENPALESWPVDKANLPDRTMANPGIVSINSTA